MPNNINENQGNNSINQNRFIQTQMDIPQYNQQAVENNQPVTNPQQTNNTISKLLLPLTLVNAIVIFAIFYTAVNKNKIVIAGILVYTVLLSFILAMKEKKNSCAGNSILIGGMLSAVVCFVISMISEEMDLWTYYTIASAATGFIGMFVANIITKLMTDSKNVKALETILYVAFFAALIGGPYFAYKKYPTEFINIMFYHQQEVIAETFEDFAVKTLKNRYGLEFKCDFEKKKTYKNEKQQIVSNIPCYDPNNNQLTVTSIPYNEGSNQYTIIDNFMDVLYFQEVKETISSKIKSITNASQVLVYFYPKKDCSFVGDCADCEEYFKRYEEENDNENRYKTSTQLNLKKNINLTTEEFIKQYMNENNYKVIIRIRGSYNKNMYDFGSAQTQILNVLNEAGLKNTYGYELTFNNYSQENYEVNVYEYKGTTNETKEFK